MNKHQTEKEAEPAAVTLTDSASAKQCPTNRFLKKQGVEDSLKRLPDVAGTALFKGRNQVVDKESESSLQGRRMTQEFIGDIDHPSAGFVAPKVHGCGYDFLGI